MSSRPADDDPFAGLSQDEADGAISNLRMGTPPPGFVREFTVGRQDELEELESRLLKSNAGGAMLLRANYGSGKTHLLRLIRDMALRSGYCVSFVEVTAQQGVRFNRLDMVLGAVCRALELPEGEKGVRHLLQRFSNLDQMESEEDELHGDRQAVTNDGRWDYQDFLTGDPLFIALRAFCLGDDDAQDLAVEYLSFPDRHATRPRVLREGLIESLHVGEPRTQRELYSALKMRTDDYHNTWSTLNGLNELAKLCGYKGLVLLFDEFEDVIQNLNNRNYQAQALFNLCEFFIDRYKGGSFFAVTPEFVRKCQDQLLGKGMFDFPFQRLDELEHFQLSPISFEEMLVLSANILTMHAQAYDWRPEENLDFTKVAQFLLSEWRENSPERVRVACKALVSLLDGELDSLEV